MAFTDHFADMMGDSIVAQPGYADARGGFIPSGVSSTLPCHMRGRDRIVRDSGGAEVVSTFQAIVLGDLGLTAEQHRYSLPGHVEEPVMMRRAIAVRTVSDETGPIYQEVILP